MLCVLLGWIDYCSNYVILFLERDGSMGCQCCSYYGSEGLLCGPEFLMVIKKLVTMGPDLNL